MSRKRQTVDEYMDYYYMERNPKNPRIEVIDVENYNQLHNYSNITCFQHDTMERDHNSLPNHRFMTLDNSSSEQEWIARDLLQNHRPIAADNYGSSYPLYNYNIVPNIQYNSQEMSNIQPTHSRNSSFSVVNDPLIYYSRETSNNYCPQETFSTQYSSQGSNQYIQNNQYDFHMTNQACTEPQEDEELSNEMDKSCRIDVLKKSTATTRAAIEGVSNVAKNFSTFAPFITSFLDIGKEIIILYEKAEHNKELCGFLLKRCNFAMSEVRDLEIRKTEHAEFFSKKENLNLFQEFTECMKKIKKFIADVSQYSKLKKFIHANSIEENCTRLEKEFEGYMKSLNFSFNISEFTAIKYDMREIKDLLFNVYGVSGDKKIQQNYFRGLDVVYERNRKFMKQQNKHIEPAECETIKMNEPLLNGSSYHATGICPSKRIGKRTSINDFEEYCFKEFSNTTPSVQSGNEQIQFEIRRQVNILKELKNSDHIIRFFGVAQEDSKYYLVTEWMEYGNLHEYYTIYRDNMSWETKTKFALDICRGVAYLHGVMILHHDIQSANILVNVNRKVKIANFGLSKKFSEVTRNITHNLENIRYMAPEKLLLENVENVENDENNDAKNDVKKKKVPYDAKCEIYSVGALLWEIAELRKPHSDLNTELLVNIRKRVKENYELPFSEDVPNGWRFVVTKAMQNEPEWRVKISDICLELYQLNKKFSSSPMPPSSSTITIPSVDEAIREHKSPNGNKRLAWQSFLYHSESDIDAKYWLGYYYYHEEIPELQRINKEERIRIALDIFKETADKGNPSAQLRYGMCLWKGEGIAANISEALHYLKKAADSGNPAAMYIVGKAYWNGGNGGIVQDRNQGANYLRCAALNQHPKAKEMCLENDIEFY